MEDTGNSDGLIHLAAKLYYVDGLSQAEVASLTKVSQAKVSRLLARARERGFVQITVTEYEARATRLEERLRRALALERVMVVRTPGSCTGDSLRKLVTHFAAPWVARMLPQDGGMAISGGRTMRWLVHNIQPARKAPGLSVVQAMGNIDGNVGPYDALELGRIVAQRWGGEFFTLNTPAILPDSDTRKTLLSLDSVRSVMERLRSVQVALVGIGTTRNSVFVERKVLSESDAASLAKAGAVGEVCGRYYNDEGEECDTPLRDRVISIDLEELRKVREVVAIVVGSDRTEAIRGAFKGKLIKSLVIDQQGANALLDSLPL